MRFKETSPAVISTIWIRHFFTFLLGGMAFMSLSSYNSMNKYLSFSENSSLVVVDDLDDSKHSSDEDVHPIMTRNKDDGFKPVYVYNRSPPEVGGRSQARQDEYIKALTTAEDKKLQLTKPVKRFFVDLAANDATHINNSYQLEKSGGWDGLCIEPNPIYWFKLAAYRKCTIVGAFVGGKQDEDGREVDVVLSSGVVGGIVEEGMDNAKKGAEEKRNLVSIVTIFEETNVPHVIDYFSLDVEGAESIVMKDFPFDKYTFKFLTIERPKPELIDLLQNQGYRQVKKLTHWGETLWVHDESVALSKEEIDSATIL
jgi:hypothetical protein